jgi:hypothetical protein
MNDCDGSCLPSLYAVRPFSANAKSKSSITGTRVPRRCHMFVGAKHEARSKLALTIISCDTKLFCDLDEIRATDEPDRKFLPELLQ